MIFQPATIALLLASLACVGLLLAAAPVAIDLIRHWNIASGSERQIQPERRTYLRIYLLSTLPCFIFLTQRVALLLFVCNADRMPSLFVGAMCAVGTPQVNAFGFPALLAQIVVFFLASIWLVINHVDTRACDYPLLRTKYPCCCCCPSSLPCCSSALLYRTQGRSHHFLLWQPVLRHGAGVHRRRCGCVAAADDDRPLSHSLTLAAGAALLYRRRQRAGDLVALSPAVAFAITMAAMRSILSLYVYEHPHHHCPFCVLKTEYAYQGYWLYLPLFVATAAGLGVGAVQPIARIPSLQSGCRTSAGNWPR